MLILETRRTTLRRCSVMDRVPGERLVTRGHTTRSPRPTDSIYLRSRSGRS